MTLEEAIKHTKDIAKDVSECTDCRMEHKQLTGWLEELLAYRKMDKHGRLLRLPCRPNDIVYRINKEVREPIIRMSVERIVLLIIHTRWKLPINMEDIFFYGGRYWKGAVYH